MNNKEKHNNWMRDFWRPSMAFVYMAVIIFDFIIAPVAWSLLQYYSITYGNISLQWAPITLSNGGLFHISMGAVLGVSAYTRGMEKLKTIEQSSPE